MEYMFSDQAESFNQPIGSRNLSSVVNLQGMFKSAKTFNQPIGNWNVSLVTNMVQMFNAAVGLLTSPLVALTGDTSSVTNMGNMFIRTKPMAFHIRTCPLVTFMDRYISSVIQMSHIQVLRSTNRLEILINH